MISIGSALNTALSSQDIVAISFLTIGFTDAVDTGGVPGTDRTLRITEAPREMVVGGNTFISATNLVGLSAPGVQANIDRDNYTVVFADNDSAMRARFASSGTSGVSLTVQLGLLDDNGTLISELLDVYKGQSATLNWTPAGSGYNLQVGFTGQLTQLGTANVRSSTPQSQNQYDATDTSMAYVHDTANDRALKWGKKT